MSEDRDGYDGEDAPRRGLHEERFTSPRQTRWGDSFSGFISNFTQEAVFSVEAVAPLVTFVLAYDASAGLVTNAVAPLVTFVVDLGATAALDVLAPAPSVTFAMGIAEPQTIFANAPAPSVTFVLNNAAPTVTSVEPPFDDPAGGQNILITGTNLAGIAAVDFNGVTGTITSQSSTQILVISPPQVDTGVPQDIDVTLIDGHGVTVVTVTGQFFLATIDHFFLPTVVQTMWQDLSRTTQCTNGSPVGRMDDSSPNGNYAGQSTNADRPEWQNAFFNGIVSYASPTQFLEALADSNWQHFTICAFFVGTPTTATPFSANLSVDSTAGGRVASLGRGQTVDAGAPQSSTGIYKENVGGATVSSKYTNADVLNDGSPHTFAWQYVGTNASHTLAVDGAIPPTTAVSTGNPGFASSAGKLVFGTNAGFSDSFTVGVFVKFNNGGAAFTSGQLALVDSFIRAQHGI